MRRALALFMGLQVADVATTEVGLRLGAVEANPLAVGLAGTAGGAVLKLGVACVASVLFYTVFRRHLPRLTWAILSVVTAALLWVVATNVMVVQELRAEARCDAVHQEWLASGEPFLDWSTVEGCDGL